MSLCEGVRSKYKAAVVRASRYASFCSTTETWDGLSVPIGDCRMRHTQREKRWLEAQQVIIAQTYTSPVGRKLAAENEWPRGEKEKEIWMAHKVEMERIAQV